MCHNGNIPRTNMYVKIHREGVRKVKAHLEMKLSRMKSIKKYEFHWKLNAFLRANNKQIYQLLLT